MTDNEKTSATKMTDNEIIKAWECCMDEMGCTKGCPCFNPKAKGSHCTVAKKLELEKLTLDLINRQKAEIESLERRLHNSQLHQKETHKALQNERALRLKEEFIESEAVKEFAEMLKPMYKVLCVDEGDWYNELDNLVKKWWVKRNDKNRSKM